MVHVEQVFCLGWASGLMVETPVETSLSHTGVPLGSSPSLLQLQLLVMYTGESGSEGSSRWVTAIHVGDTGRVLGFWLYPCSSPVCCGHLGSKAEGIEALSFQIMNKNKCINKEMFNPMDIFSHLAATGQLGNT